jgi:hypothetical protein
MSHDKPLPMQNSLPNPNDSLHSFGGEHAALYSLHGKWAKPFTE